MSSTLITDLLAREGLAPLLALRAEGNPPPPEQLASYEERIARADFLAVGAAADAVRRLECGDEARVYVPFLPRLAEEGTSVVGANEAARGTSLLRRIASLRLTGPAGARIIVDFGALGLELAQIALSFGATDLAGPIASRRGLPLADGDQNRQLVKRREIAGFIERAGFKPVFVNADTRRPHVPSSDQPNQERP